MDKADLRATAEFYEPYLNRADVVDDIEAALTAAHTAGGKDEYDKGWNDAKEAAAKVAHDPNLEAALEKGIGKWNKTNYLTTEQRIRRLKKGE